MGIMAVGQIIVLSALFVQTFSAPSGCIESCDFHQTSYQSRYTSGGHRDHAGLVGGSAHLNDHDYARPGNWTERNQYSTDSGRGKVHEERGQYVQGSKRVRYYKKNFTSSYGNVNELGTAELGELNGQRRYDSLHIPSNQYFESQAHSDQLGQAVTKESEYNSQLHSSQQTQSLSTRIDSRSEKLEDFGEYGGHSQVNQHIPRINIQTNDRQHHVETVPANWSRVDSYKTDNGNGRVFEEEGQYVTGPKQVRYYNKNYTSSYSTSGVPPNNVDSTIPLDKLHSELQSNLHKQLDDFRREFHQASSAGGHVASATHVGSTTDLTRETVGFHDLQTAESDSYRQQLNHVMRVPSSGITHHHTVDHQERETFVDARQPSSTNVSPENIGGYSTESQRTLHQNHKFHVSRVHPTSHSDHSFSGYTQIPIVRDDYQTSLRNVHASKHHIDETQRAREVLGGYRSSSVAQNQLAESSRRIYNPSSSYSTYPGRRDETRHYQEHWSTLSSHTGGNVAPDFTHGHASRAHYDRDAYNEQNGRYHATQGYDSHAHTSDSSYTQNAAHKMSSGQLVTGSLDLGQAARGTDCTEETQQYRQETRYHRRYKRDDHHDHVQHHRQPTDNKDSTQQHRKLSQIVDDQHLKDLTQKSEQFMRQTRESDHLTQQTSDQLEFEQQTVGDQYPEDLTQQTQNFDDFTQQTSDKLEFVQQIVGDQHPEDLTQQTQDSNDFTQQTSSQLEFGQQTVDDQYSEDLTQQTQDSDDLTQQTSGKLEFGQQTVDDQLQQQQRHFENLTQQTEGQLELGRQIVDALHSEDLTQHQGEQLRQQTQRSDDFTQPKNDKQFSQQIVGNQYAEDLTQQTQDSDNFTQQTSDKLEFDQQTVDNPYLEGLTQQTEQFQRHEIADFTQQTVGKYEYEQQNDDTRQSGQLAQQFPQQRERSEFRNNDFTQQNEQFTQQASDDVITQQTQSINKYTKPKSQRLEKFDENNDDLTGRTTVSDDFTQQTMGQLDVQQIQSPSKPKVGNQHLENFTQQNQDLAQQLGQLDNFAQQTTENLEYGQQQEQQRKPNTGLDTNWPGYNTQHSGSFSQQWHQYPFHDDNKQSEWRLDEMSQKTEFHRDFMPQTDGDQQFITGVIKPAPKPKPRQRLQKHDSISSHTDATDFDLFNPIEASSDFDTDLFHGRNIQDSSRPTDSSSNYPRSRIIYAQGGSVFDNEKENMDRLHWVHKSNDATVGLQWHYTYHPSDLTNIQGSHDNYYPHHNINSKPRQQIDDVQQQSTSQAQHDKYDQQSGLFQQSGPSFFDNQFNQNSPKEASSRVIPLQHDQNLRHAAELEKESIQTTEQAERGMESRILEAYGGGPYDASRNDDTYRRVRPNPSATLPPIYLGEDPWDIREKPKERIIPWTVVNTFSTTNTPTEETTTQIVKERVTTEAAAPSFWNRLGHKITSTYDKAKEKAKEIFG